MIGYTWELDLIGWNMKLSSNWTFGDKMENSHIPNDLLDLTKTIPAKYFLRDDFDQTRFWLESLPGNYERDFYDVELSVYKKGLTAVVSKITSKVLDNHTQFSRIVLLS